MTGTSQFLTTKKRSSFFDTELYSAGDGVRPRFTTPDYFTKLVIPVLSLCGSIAGVLKDQPRVALGLGVLAAITTHWEVRHQTFITASSSGGGNAATIALRGMFGLTS